ncbi:MAG: carboxylesterase family protein [Algoriphagus sp.]|uniref:carboxylesterase/lipase family protein n=1 Tax=Algoriphagus sp. TaxID=1872435 RepID=UPI002604473A|nr:carboxylesterase family protein [Algoriphagus sp.]MDG1278254.1 carboxylesterase family protein [Algoriphagus sp.]
MNFNPRSLLIIFFSAILALPHFSKAQHLNSIEVKTEITNGTIAGYYDTKTNIKKYLGIPFAKPPVGDLRWKAPQPLENWDGVKETKKFGPRAVQAPIFGDMDFKSDGMSEDCLYLNVWTPATRNDKNLPVLVYFYGGGFSAGDGSEPRYNGEAMAQQGIVVVTVNYRLNVFGFLAHPDLSAETAHKGSGNYGLMDQHASLKWVKENISAFGGDPDKVTIAGESAGSISVSYQMASPLSKGLIAGAIGESGAGINPTLAPNKLEDAEKIGTDFITQAGFNSIAEMRKLSTAEVYEIFLESKLFGFPVTIDGYFLPKTLPEIFEAKEQAMVPLLAGWNSAEIPGMAFMQGQPYTSEAFIKKVQETYPEDYEEVLTLHPHTNPQEVERSATDLAADRFIAYSTWKWLDLHAKNSDQPVYRYLYSKLRPPLKNSNLTTGLAGGTVEGGPKMPEPIGAPHACEIEYALGNLPLVDVFAWTPDDYKVSKTFMGFFANFIKTGNPNGENLPEWKAIKVTDSNPPVMDINTESKIFQATDTPRYQFHDRFYGNDKK